MTKKNTSAPSTPQPSRPPGHADEGYTSQNATSFQMFYTWQAGSADGESVDIEDLLCLSFLSFRDTGAAVISWIHSEQLVYVIYLAECKAGS